MASAMDTTDDLRLLLASRHTLIVAEMQDEERFMEILRRAALVGGYPVWTWSVTRGLSREGFDPQMGTTDPRKALDFVASLPDPGVFVMADIHAAFGDAVVVLGSRRSRSEGGPGRRWSSPDRGARSRRSSRAWPSRGPWSRPPVRRSPPSFGGPWTTSPRGTFPW